VLALGGSNGTKHRTKGGSGSGGGTASVALHGVGDYDPQGTGGEHASSAPLATDGNSQTAWDTEHYASAAFGGLKSGLGLVLDARRAVKLAKLTVTTATPSFTARILAGNSPSGGFSPDSTTQTVSGTTTFTLDGKSARYYVVWITQLPPGGYAQIQEVKAG
jgi:hypothetical protein